MMRQECVLGQTGRGPGSLQGVDPGSPDRQTKRFSPVGVCCQLSKYFRIHKKCLRPPTTGGVLCASLGDVETGKQKHNLPIEYMTSTGEKGRGKSDAQRAAVRLESLHPTGQRGGTGIWRCNDNATPPLVKMKYRRLAAHRLSRSRSTTVRLAWRRLPCLGSVSRWYASGGGCSVLTGGLGEPAVFIGR